MSEFPHPGYPIAPQLLRPVLSVGLPASFARLTGTFPLLADLDERIWSYVDRAVAERLGNLVITRAYQMRTAAFWRMTYFPRLTSALRLDDIRIERFTYESLSSLFAREIPEGLAGLAKFTLDRLISEIFGVKPLIDLLVAVHFHIEQSPMSRQAVARLTRDDIETIIRTPTAWLSHSHKYFPFLPKTVSLEDLQLSVRAHNCIDTLLKEGVISDLADLSRLTVGQVMDRANFGLRSLPELLNEIEPLVLEPPSVQTTASQVAVAHSNQISRQDAQQIISQSKPLHLYLERYFPYIPPTTELADMNLDVRTYNCLTELIREGVISRPSDLSLLTFGQVVRTKNFGRKSLSNLLRSIEQLRAQRVTSEDPERELPKPLSSNLTRAAEKLAQSRVAGRVHCSDPRMSEVCRDLLYAANNSSGYPHLDPKATKSTLQEVARRLVVRIWDPPGASELVSAIRRVRLRLAELMRMRLETELCSLGATRLKKRNLEMMLALRGWTGDLPGTLQSVGDSFGITRERVRQIANKFERVHSHRKAFLPGLERVLRFVAQRVPAIADDIEKDLQARGLTLSRFRVEAIIECGKRFGQPVPFVFDESRGVRVVTEGTDAGFTRLIAIHARRAASKYGIANTVDLKEELTNTIRSGIDPQLLSRVVYAMRSYEDLGKGWFWIRDLPRNHMLTIVRKVLAVAPRIHVSEMRAAIANDPRGMGFAPPKEVVLCFCQGAAECDVEDDFIIVRPGQDPSPVLSDIERAILDIFRTHGPLLSRKDFDERCVEHGIKRPSLTLNTARLAIMARYAPGVYGLRGAVFSPDDLNRLSPRRQSRFSEHGWTESAEPWAATELSASALSSGIVQLPASFRQQMSGHYVLRTEDGLTIGQLVVSDQATWGLGPLFRRRGGEPGDILLLTFDLRRREVTARLGDLSVLPELGNLAEEIVE